MKSNSRSYDFLWCGIALFPLLLITALLPLRPHDYWWYLRLGRDVLASGVPAQDTYSSIQFGQPIVYQSWLSAVLMWMIYRAGGIPLTFATLMLTIAITYTLLWILLREVTGPRIATLLTLVAALAGSNNWTMRPQLFTYPLFVATLFILLRRQKYYWILIPIAFLWTNLHGSFILFFVLVGSMWMFGQGERRSLGIMIALSLACTLINPRVTWLWRAVIDTFINPGIRDLSPEWLPPINRGWQMNLFFAWLILLVPLASIARRVSLAYWGLFIAFTWLALTGVRYVIWDLFVLPVITGALLPEVFIERIDAPQETRSASFNFVLGGLLLLLPLASLPGFREHWWHDPPPALDSNTPVAAADWLALHPELRGPMWNDVVFGSYLIYALPERPVWIDTRIQVIYTPQQAEGFLFVQSAQPGWDAFLDEHQVNLLFLARTQVALVNAVEKSSTWCQQYEDDVALIFARCEAMP